MPKFKKNPNPIKNKRTPYKMKGYSYPGKSPLHQDKKEITSVEEIKSAQTYKELTTGGLGGGKGLKRLQALYPD